MRPHRATPPPQPPIVNSIGSWGGFAPWLSLFLLICLLLLSLPGWALTPGQGDRIINVATLRYDGGSTTTSSIIHVVVPSSSSIRFLKNTRGLASGMTQPVLPSRCSSGNAPNLDAVTSLYQIDHRPPAPQTLLPAELYASGEVIYIEVYDPDRDLDNKQQDTLDVVLMVSASGDSETLTISETEVDSGVFIGYIVSTSESATVEDCALSVVSGERIIATYTDRNNTSDRSESTALVDPYGRVFSSASGTALNGAVVTLLEAVSGQPAQVFGDDGVSRYPATVTSGQETQDSSGTRYSMAAGGYRFPFVLPGDYLLQVTPPNGYAMPSKADNAAMQSLPGGPFALTVGSRGERFTVPVGPALQIDIPLDPKLTNLYVTKESSKRRAAIGDLIEYRVTVENPTLAPASPVDLIDQLPLGLGYVHNSLRLDDGSRPEPQLSRDGRRLTIALGTLAPGDKRTLSYVVEAAAGTQVGENVNSAFATAAGNPASNTANASVEIVEDLQRDRSHLVGRVMVGNCAPEPAPEGEMRLQLTSLVSGQAVHYRAAVSLNKVGAEALRLRVELPLVLDYRLGSARLNGQPLDNPSREGHTLLFDLGAQPADWRGQLTFATDSHRNLPGDFTTRAVLLLDRAGLKDVSTPSAINTISNPNLQLKLDYAEDSEQPTAANRAALVRMLKRLQSAGVGHAELTYIHERPTLRASLGAAERRAAQATARARALLLAEWVAEGLGLDPNQVSSQASVHYHTPADTAHAASHTSTHRMLVSVRSTQQKENDHFLLTRADSGIQSMRLLGDTGEPSPATLGADLPGLEGVRLFMEDGRFADTDAQGLYHFEALTPGSHVVQLDPDSLPPGYELVQCVDNPQFASNPGSQMVDLQGGTLWRADFFLRKLGASIGSLGLRLHHTQEGNQLRYIADVKVSERPLSNARLMVGLPRGQRYVAGSSRLDGAPLADPENVFGRLLFPLVPGESSSWQAQISFTATLDPTVNGEQVSTAQIYYDLGAEKNQRSVLAENRLYVRAAEQHNYLLTTHFDTLSSELGDEDRAALDRLVDELRGRPLQSVRVIGHADLRPIHSESIYRDNRELSLGRAESIADYLLAHLPLREDQVEVHAMGAKQPLASGRDEEALALNRRVELEVRSHAQVSMIPLSRDSGERNELHPIPPPGSSEQQSEPEALALQHGILGLESGDHIAARIGTLRLARNAQLDYRLTLDGKPISDERIGFRMFDDKSNLTLVSYIGVDFGAPGEHTLSLIGSDNFGVVRFRQAVKYIRTGKIASLRLLDNNGNIADGKQPVILRAELLDEQGELIPASAELELRGGDLRPYLTPEQVQIDPSMQQAADRIAIGSDGVMRFMPVNASGLYEVTLGLGEQEYHLRTYVKPQLREEWLLVGIAEGTLAQRNLSGNLQSLAEVGEEDGLYRDGKLAFYAKGRVRGDWLLTLAYDSETDRNDSSKALYQTIDPERYYTLYGDTSEQFFDAPSSERLYLRLEAEQFNLLFGDFDSALTVTELARYSRSLTGTRLQYEGETTSLVAFASDTNQAFIRDTIRGDGTSGLYRLSRRNLRLNSEKISIEVRDRFHSEQLISRRELTRYIDYQIDHQDGTLFFKEPIYSRDDQLNPVWIVVEYEVVDSSERSLVAGGRAAVSLLENKLVVGATLVSESAEGAEARLQGLDLAYSFSDSTRLRGEVSSSHTDAGGTRSEGSAWLAEISHLDSEHEGRLYAQRYTPDFGIGQANGSELGTAKLGAELDYKLTALLRLGMEASHQENLGTGAIRNLASSELTLEHDLYLLGVGLTMARDEFSTGLRQESDLLTLRAQRKLADNRVTLRASSEQALNERASSDYPSRLLVGVDYQASTQTTLFAETELADGSDQRSTLNRIGLSSSPWSQGRVTSTLASESSEYGPRTYATVGLAQGFTLSPNLSLDLGLDHSQTLREPGAVPFNADVPLSSGSTSNDFTALTGGLTYREELWSGNLRAEQRMASDSHKRGLFIGFYRQQSPGFGLSSTLEHFATEQGDGKRAIDQEFNLSLAWRPVTSRWVTLDRITYVSNEKVSADADSHSHKLVNNLNTNYLFDRRNQVALQHGIKRSEDYLDTGDYSTTVQLYGLEYRHTISHRWDLAVRGSSLVSAHSRDYSWGAELGLSPGRNLWLSLGYNLRGYRDEDLTAAGYTAAGPYLKLRLSLDRQTQREVMAWWE